MKKFLFVVSVLFLLLFLVPLAPAAEMNWRTANQITIGWDPVTVLDNGNPLPAGQSIAYRIYIRPDPAGTPVAALNLVTTPSATVTFVSEGIFDIGVSTLRMQGAEVLSESAIAWSNDAQYVQGGNIFGGKYYVSGGMIHNMR
jgi:hypothetical protein